MKKPLIINIQKFSVHDGDGIRTTVFFKGCPLSCSWCHNAESCSYQKELMYYEERCTGCGMCEAVCPNKGVRMTEKTAVTDRMACTSCGKCTDYCVRSAREVVGREWELDELVRVLLRDFPFYETSGGGVTLSGGEALAQEPEYILELLRKLKNRGCNMAVDTCGDVPYERIKSVIPYTDTFLYDIKAFTPEIHERYTGKENERILENLKRLSLDGARINIRIPVVPGVNDGEEMKKIIRFVKENVKTIKINLLPYHNIGTDKAKRVGKENTEVFAVPTPEAMEHIKEWWLAEGFANVEIGG